jgi:preprotein translocase subunit SecF
MRFPIQIFPTVPNYNFIGHRRIGFAITALLVALTAWSLATKGLNFGIDFTGGTLMEVRAKTGNADPGDIRQRLSAVGIPEIQVQTFGTENDALIRIGVTSADEGGNALVEKAQQSLTSSYDIRRTELVGPTVSGELAWAAILGVLAAMGGILIYLWFRFEWQFALGAMIANVHDLVLTLGFMALMQVDFDLTSIAALLTILGYSLNDTVVVFDRIREMLRRYKKLPMPDLLNIAINSTLSRSIITHLTVTLALLALFFFGGHAIHGFVTTMMFGVVLVGTYTSVFIAAPILIYLGVGEGRQESAEAAESVKGQNIRFSA